MPKDVVGVHLKTKTMIDLVGVGAEATWAGRSGFVRRQDKPCRGGDDLRPATIKYKRGDNNQPQPTI
jgi:hypothetical protein